MTDSAPGELALLSGWLSQTAAIQRVDARFTALADAAPVAVLVTTRTQTIFANERLGRLLGMPPAEVPSTPLRRFFPERELRASVRSALRRAWSGAAGDLGVIPITRADGARRHVAIALRPLPLELEPTLLVALTEGSAGVDTVPDGGHDALRVFGLHLAVLANDLRAPLTAHLGHLGELTERTDLPADLRDVFRLYRQVTGQALERLGRAMEWGRRAPLTEHVDLRSVVNDAVAALESEAAAFTTGTHLLLDLEPVPPVLGVGSQLQVAVEHVLRNADEALRGRGGTIRVRLAAEAGRITLTITDDGPGIPDSIYPQVFEPFSSTKSVVTGLGLGLAIVKDIVGRHGGAVALDTGSGGTTVTLTLRALAERPAELEVDRRPRVLIVDDNIDLQETLRLLIERAGYEVITVEDADRALDVLAQHPLDAMIIDVQLAGRDGLALLEEIALWHPEMLPRIALQTAYAYEDRVGLTARRHGVPVLAKPCAMGVLLETVGHLAARGERDAHPR